MTYAPAPICTQDKKTGNVICTLPSPSRLPSPVSRLPSRASRPDGKERTLFSVWWSLVLGLLVHLLGCQHSFSFLPLLLTPSRSFPPFIYLAYPRPILGPGSWVARWTRAPFAIFGDGPQSLTPILAWTRTTSCVPCVVRGPKHECPSDKKEPEQGSER